MKFLTKMPKSSILKNGLTYKAGNVINNRKLLKALLDEQKSFCAYTEQYILRDEEGTFPESVDIEHFTATLKNTPSDDYYNWYAVLHKINIKKRDEKYENATFHQSRFFQNRVKLDARIEYDANDNFYYEKDKEDIEARDFIDFIQIDSPMIAKRRLAHLKRLKTIREALKTNVAFVEYLLKHPNELAFITAIEKTFEVELESKL